MLNFLYYYVSFKSCPLSSRVQTGSGFPEFYKYNHTQRTAQSPILLKYGLSASSVGVDLDTNADFIQIWALHYIVLSISNTESSFKSPIRHFIAKKGSSGVVLTVEFYYEDQSLLLKKRKLSTPTWSLLQFWSKSCQ